MTHLAENSRNFLSGTSSMYVMNSSSISSSANACLISSQPVLNSSSLSRAIIDYNGKHSSQSLSQSVRSVSQHTLLVYHSVIYQSINQSVIYLSINQSIKQWLSQSEVLKYLLTNEYHLQISSLLFGTHIFFCRIFFPHVFWCWSDVRSLKSGKTFIRILCYGFIPGKTKTCRF